MKKWIYSRDTSLQGDNFVVFYYLSVFEICPVRKGGL